ncbi:MAG: UDP-glucose--hexose-1-phosphate uridylyltransferase [Halanaerobiales bacterium]|nr:UDP-glucose--hexose-1-phosphate uridylyltransferase [Halanaerobiales bacterium]
MTSMPISLTVEKLLDYAENKGLIKGYDRIVARNEIRDLLNITEVPKKNNNKTQVENIEILLKEILDYAVDNNLINDTVTERDLFDVRVMGKLMPRQSEVNNAFWKTVNQKNIKKATDQYYNLSIASNYIRKTRIAKNLNWISQTNYGEIEITINLSKPEKDPVEIEKANKLPKISYPKCYLCLENIGFTGNLNHPARQNHRIIKLKLNDEIWFFQYSPYLYYNEHSIVFNKEHRPMQINKDTFKALFDFIDIFPHYFIGSNADLPLVGGSILNHDHFQGGRHHFPMEAARKEEYYEHSDFKKVNISRIHWPMSVIRLQSKSRKNIINLAVLILKKWRKYTDLSADIKAYSMTDCKLLNHNTITPIVRKKDEYYQTDLVLRNNRKNDEYPTGIFHPHKNLHHIKKENIGLIEVMGRAILPGRLKKELKLIEDVLSNKKSVEKILLVKKMNKHKKWILKLVKKYGTNLDPDQAKKVIKLEVGQKFLQVLKDASVFKNNSDGNDKFNQFMAEMNINRKEV